jgi:hypothetical protein
MCISKVARVAPVQLTRSSSIFQKQQFRKLTMASSNSYEQQNQQQGGQPRPLQMGAKGAYIVRLLMVGDSSCGKTSLVLRFDQNVFSTKFVTTIGVDYRDKMVKVRYTWVAPHVRLNFCICISSCCLPTDLCRLKERQCVCNFGIQLARRDSDH